MTVQNNLAKAVALSYKVPMFHKSPFRLGVAGFKVVIKDKTFLNLFGLLCRASFREESFTSPKIFLASSLG